MENMFAHYAQSDGFPAASSTLKGEAELFWNHMQTGLNSVVKMLEDAVRGTPSKNANPFSVVLLDFAWLNSQLGHHLAHICSGTPHTSLVAVNPPGKLAKMVNATTKVVCIGIRPLMLPNTNRLLLLRDFLRACANLAGKSLPPDPAANTSATLAALGVAGGVSGIEGSVGTIGIGSTPQYVPILPKPPTMLVSPHPGVDITASSSGYVVAASGSTSSNILANTLIGASRSPLQKPQMPPKPPVPRPAVRHIPADDWLTYKLDHAKLYKCGADISKELENHSLYIHDVSDIWGLYPRHSQKQAPDMGGPSSSRNGMRQSVGKGAALSHTKGRSSGPPAKQRRTASHHHVPPPPPPPVGYFDEEDDDFEEGLADEEDDDYGGDYAGPSSYLSPSPPSRHHRFSSRHQTPSSSSRGMYQRRQQHPESYGASNGTRRRPRRSPRW
ncbi:hypothetical protein Aperf_G00000087656 [Anoplocephala perfoliata]